MNRLSRLGPRETLKLILEICDYGLTIAFTQLGGKIFEGADYDPL